MKLYWIYVEDSGGELVVCADDKEAAETAKAWAEEYDAEDMVEWQEITKVDGYRIIVGEKVAE